MILSIDVQSSCMMPFYSRLTHFLVMSTLKISWGEEKKCMTSIASSNDDGDLKEIVQYFRDENYFLKEVK